MSALIFASFFIAFERAYRRPASISPVKGYTLHLLFLLLLLLLLLLEEDTLSFGTLVFGWSLGSFSSRATRSSGRAWTLTRCARVIVVSEYYPMCCVAFVASRERPSTRDRQTLERASPSSLFLTASSTSSRGVAVTIVVSSTSSSSRKEKEEEELKSLVFYFFFVSEKKNF